MNARGFTVAVLFFLSLNLSAAAAEVRGVISKVNPEMNELVLSARGLGIRGTPLSFVLSPETRVLFGEQPGELADLAPGKRVRVAYQLQNGKQVATAVRVLGGRPARPAAATAGGDKVTGVLLRVGITDREIVVLSSRMRDGEEVETIIQVPQSVRITKDGMAATLEDLQEEEQVIVEVDRGNGMLVAVSIQVGAAAPEVSRITRLRQILQQVDRYLEMAEMLRRQMDQR